MSELNSQVETEAEEQGKAKETSILFEPFSLWVLMISLLTAVWFQFFPLIIVSAFLLSLSLIIVTWKNQSLKRVHPSIHLPKQRLFVGDEFIVDAAVKNDKWLPLIWLEWEFKRSEFIRWKKEELHTYLIRFLWLLWYQSVNWQVKGKAVRRGVYRLGEVTLRSGDGFRFAEKELPFDLNGELLIYPEIVPVQVPSFQQSLQWEVKGRQGGFVEDPLLINGIRDYEAGDEWQRFNWRASARTGKLQTNIYQPIVSEQLITYIDVHTFTIYEDKYPDEPLRQQQYVKEKRETFEKVLSIVASAAMTYDERGIKVGLLTDGVSDLGEKLSPVMPSAELTPYMDQLARLTQQADRRISYLNELLFIGAASPVFVFCEKVTKEHVVWYERNQHSLDIYFYYAVNNTYADKLERAAQQIDQLLTVPVVITDEE